MWGPPVKPIRVYTKDYCGYCVAARRLLDDKNLDYEEIDVSRDMTTRAWLRQVSGQHTVPQVFIGARPVGGYTELAALERSGELDRLLHDAEP